MSVISCKTNRQSTNELNHELICNEINSFYNTLKDQSSPPTIFQAMLSDLLEIEGYNETLIAMGTDIPIEIIKSINTGIIKNPSNEVSGKLLRFYNQMIYTK